MLNLMRYLNPPVGHQCLWAYRYGPRTNGLRAQRLRATGLRAITACGLVKRSADQWPAGQPPEGDRPVGCQCLPAGFRRFAIIKQMNPFLVDERLLQFFRQHIYTCMLFWLPGTTSSPETCLRRRREARRGAGAGAEAETGPEPEAEIAAVRAARSQFPVPSLRARFLRRFLLIRFLLTAERKMQKKKK